MVTKKVKLAIFCATPMPFSCHYLPFLKNIETLYVKLINKK